MSTKDKYELIDLTYVNEMALGDDDFIVQMIEMYLESIPENIAKLDEAMINKDFVKIIFYAHSLKGAFSFIGSTRLTEICDEIEHSSRPTINSPKTNKLISEILSLSKKVADELIIVLEKIRTK